MILRYGQRGPQIITLQQRLAAAGYALAADGIFGNATETAVRRYQKKHDLVADGIVGPITWAALSGQKPPNRILRQSDLVAAAQTLAVDLAAVQAVTEIEAHNTGFIKANRPTLLFERHIMRRQMRQHGIDTSEAERAHPNLVNAQPGGYSGGLGEHIRLIRAQNIHAPSAPESASWGLFQIMGFHWQRLGYDSAYDYARQMTANEQNQLDAFVRYIRADAATHQALADHDWPEFARRYNGPDYARNDYDTRLARAYARHSVAQPKKAGKKKSTRPTA